MKDLLPAAKKIIEECYGLSVELLKKNSTKQGIIACTDSEKSAARHYAGIFGRDAAICSLGMVVSRDPGLFQSARDSLLTLARYQAPNGQIPKYVKPELGEVDFWYAGCIDATLWWLIAVDFIDRHHPGDNIREKLDREVSLALQWLSCQEHQRLFLVQQNEASDWADIMPRSGFVLYSNALWYYVKLLYGIKTAHKTRHFFRYIFYPFDRQAADERRASVLAHYIRNRVRRSNFFLSFVNFSFWGEEVDIFGNILSSLLGLTSVSGAARMTDHLMRIEAHKPYPVRSVHTPVRKNSPLWRPYMERHRQNYPHQYHNGGIWPFTGGFWVLLLSKVKRNQQAWNELARVAEANSLNNWEFNEWLHGKTGRPMGMAGQSWNAAMYVLAYHALAEKKSFL